MPDYYSILGVARTATADEIKRAYRRLASQHHPDKGGDTQRFQEIQTAYDVLGDAQKRADYDNPSPFKTRPDGGWQQAGPFDFNNIFEMFGARFPDHMQSRPATSARLQLWISLGDVAVGGTRVIAVGTRGGNSNSEINIPPGIEDGDTVRYAAAGPGGVDLVVTFRIRPDPEWTRNGDSVSRDIEVDFWTCILGGEITVPTITGSAVVIVIPASTRSGTVMRVRGHGLPRKNMPTHRGDLLIRIQAQLPKNIPQSLIDQIRAIQGQ